MSTHSSRQEHSAHQTPQDQNSYVIFFNYKHFFFHPTQAFAFR